MSIGSSIFLIAVGAVLRYAVTDNLNGVSLATIGLILMIAGIVGLLLSLFWLTVYRGRTTTPVVRRERYVEREPLP